MIWWFIESNIDEECLPDNIEEKTTVYMHLKNEVKKMLMNGKASFVFLPENKLHMWAAYFLITQQQTHFYRYKLILERKNHLFEDLKCNWPVSYSLIYNKIRKNAYRIIYVKNIAQYISERAKTIIAHDICLHSYCDDLFCEDLFDKYI